MSRNLLLLGAQWHAAKLRAVAAVEIIYRRGALFCELTATPTKPQYQTNAASDYEAQTERRDWLITAADLILAGVMIEPADGDWIETKAVDGTTEIYTLAEYENGKAFRYSDPTKTQLRAFSTRKQ